MNGSATMAPSDKTVVILFLCLICLIVLLIFLYKKLNREAEGEYTIRRMVYKEGGLRDQVRDASLAVGTRFGIQLWPRSEEGEEMQEVRDEEEQVEDGSNEEDSEEDEQGVDGGDDDDDDGSDDIGDKGSDTPDDGSSVDGSEPGEHTRLTPESEDKGSVEKKGEEEEEVEDGAENGASGGAGLSINLEQFSGSVTWSEGEGGVTVL